MLYTWHSCLCDQYSSTYMCIYSISHRCFVWIVLPFIAYLCDYTSCQRIWVRYTGLTLSIHLSVCTSVCVSVCPPVCPSIHPWTKLFTLYLLQYDPGQFHIYTSYQPTSGGVLYILSVFNFKNLNFRQIVLLMATCSGLWLFYIYTLWLLEWHYSNCISSVSPDCKYPWIEID